MWQGYGRLPLILHVLHTKGVSANYFICFLSIFFCYVIHQYFLFAVWTGSTSYARTQGQTLILRLCLLTTHVHLQMVLLHLHLSIFQLQQLQSLHPMHRLEHTVYDAHISFFLKRCYQDWGYNKHWIIPFFFQFSCAQPFPPTAAAANANALAGWMANASASSSVQAAVVTASSIPVPQNQGLNFNWTAVVRLIGHYGFEGTRKSKEDMA